ncbi:Chitinase 2, partial [Coemansia sp. RSA 2607]
WIDNDYVQFYNNPCNLANIGNQWNFDYSSWDKLTKGNPNPNSKMYVGLPAGSGAAGNGYLDLGTVKADLAQLYSSYPSTFGGIMLWDASWYSNNKAYVQELSSWFSFHHHTPSNLICTIHRNNHYLNDNDIEINIDIDDYDTNNNINASHMFYGQ